jgi:hypothetical protein
MNMALEGSLIGLKIFYKLGIGLEARLLSQKNIRFKFF